MDAFFRMSGNGVHDGFDTMLYLILECLRDLAESVWDPICQTWYVARADGLAIVHIDGGILANEP